VWAEGAAAPARGTKVRVDDGAWLALLALPFAALLFRRGWLMGLAVLAFGLASAPRPALAFDWHALWQRADQQAASAYAAGGARERVAALARLAPDSPWRAALLYRSGRYAEAAELYAGRDDAAAWYNRANALALEGRLEEALSAYDAALERSPSMRDARANRALVRAAIARRFANEQGRSDAARQRGRGPGPAPRAGERRASGDEVARRPQRAAPAGPERRASRRGAPAAPGEGRDAARRQLDALLAEVPDDPGELLANRFARELRLRGDWTHDPGEPW
jgi:Ca-activated chloride channel family protein